MSSNTPTFRQLCVLAREQITADPTIDTGEWADRLKRRLITLGFADAERPDQITAAMTAVEHEMPRTLGPRPVSRPTPPADPATTRPQQNDPPWTGVKRVSSGWVSLASLITSVQADLRSSAPPSSVLPAVTAHEQLPIPEPAALTVFYVAIHEPGADRLAILRTFAELAINRPAGWDYERVRADAARPHTLRADGCFVCASQDRAIAWHHVIQVQHGGSNTPRNRVALCRPCHAEIHPWLPPVARQPEGWSSLGDIAARVPGRPAGSLVPMRTWQIANRRMRCGYNDAHVIQPGETYLVMDTGGPRTLVRCQVCAVRHGHDATEHLETAKAEAATE